MNVDYTRDAHKEIISKIDTLYTRALQVLILGELSRQAELDLFQHQHDTSNTEQFLEKLHKFLRAHNDRRQAFLDAHHAVQSDKRRLLEEMRAHPSHM